MEIEQSTSIFLFSEFLTELPDEISLKDKAPFYGDGSFTLENQHFNRMRVSLEIASDLNGKQTSVVTGCKVQQHMV